MSPTARRSTPRRTGARSPAAAPPPPATRDVTAPPPPTRDVTAPPPVDAATAALQTPDQVRAVAHLLSEAADAYNRRLKAEAATLSSGEVFARLQEEQRLRGVANQLFFEAADRTLADAVEAQADLEATLQDARDRLDRFERFAQVLDLVADLLVLAGAIVARKAPTVIAALKEVRNDLAAPRATAAIAPRG